MRLRALPAIGVADSGAKKRLAVFFPFEVATLHEPDALWNVNPECLMFPRKSFAMLFIATCLVAQAPDSKKPAPQKRELSLAQHYHEGSSYPGTIKLKKWSIRMRPTTYKEYPDKTLLKLPAPTTKGGPSVLTARQIWMQGHASQQPLTLPSLSTLLHSTQGVSAKVEVGSRTVELRTAPSAGALYPVNCYVLSQNLEGLKDGLYYYHPQQHGLVPAQDGLRPQDIAQWCGNPDQVEHSRVTLIYTATTERTAFKFGDRAYRYMAMDTGHAAFNAGLSAAALGFNAPLVARFEDAALIQALGLDENEVPMLIQPLDCPEIKAGREPRFESAAPIHGIRERKFIDLIHGGTQLKRMEAIGPFPAFKMETIQSPVKKTDKPLPPTKPSGQLFDAIQARRSVREFTNRSLTLSELSALCESISNISDEKGCNDPLLKMSAPLKIQIYLKKSRDLKAGMYTYHPKTRSLQLTQTGGFSKRFQSACLEQDFVGSATAIFFLSAPWKDLQHPDGDRGYRYACTKAGIAAEGLYLQGQSLGLGVCGVGAFEDAKLNALLGLKAQAEVCLYVVPMGEIVKK